MVTNRDTNFILTHKVSILIVDYPYTLNLTAPITVVINDNGKTGGNVLFGATRDLRIYNGASVIYLSGANAMARNGPDMASVVSPGSRRLLSCTCTLRDGDRRPLSGTIVNCYRSGGVGLLRYSSTGILTNGNLYNAMGNISIRNNGSGCVRAIYTIPTRCVRSTHELSTDKGAPLFFTTNNSFVNLVYISSAIGTADGRTISSLGGVNMSIIVVANSGRAATSSVTYRINVSGIVTGILPSNGRRGIHTLSSFNSITVINSNVGSTPTLAETSANVTVNTNASITVRTTSIILVGDSPGSVSHTIALSEGIIEGVGRGLF